MTADEPKRQDPESPMERGLFAVTVHLRRIHNLLIVILICLLLLLFLGPCSQLARS